MPRKQGYRHIGFQVTEEEYSAVEDAAKGRGLAMSEYLRSLLGTYTHGFVGNMPKRGEYQRATRSKNAEYQSRYRQSLKSNTRYIYALKDPRDDQIRYVGKTDNLHTRLKNHMADARAGRWVSKRADWLNELTSQTLEPVVVMLEKTTPENELEREAYWVQEMIRRGYLLLNHFG